MKAKKKDFRWKHLKLKELQELKVTNIESTTWKKKFKKIRLRQEQRTNCKTHTKIYLHKVHFHEYPSTSGRRGFEIESHEIAQTSPKAIIVKCTSRPMSSKISHKTSVNLKAHVKVKIREQKTCECLKTKFNNTTILIWYLRKIPGRLFFNLF